MSRIHPRMVYLIPSFKCNLSCPHCHIKNQPETFNEENFIKSMNEFDGYKLLFGGEPFYDKERAFRIYNASKKTEYPILSCSTNLLILDDDIINLFKEIGVCTSWNLVRFSDSEYNTWKQNITRLAENNIKVMILITLTKDLISLSHKEFIDIVKSWDMNGISEIKLEHYIGDDNDAEYYKQTDQWITDLYDLWDLPIAFPIKNPEDYWYRDCKEIHTLLPDGQLINVCPQGSGLKPVVCEDCFNCSRSEKCIPCKFHSNCSFPARLASKLKKV